MWRNDCDYWSKLTPVEKEYYNKFVGEYYRAEFSQQHLHTQEQRKSIYAAQNAANNDVVTQTGDNNLTEQHKARGKSRHSIYAWDDYPWWPPAGDDDE